MLKSEPFYCLVCVGGFASTNKYWDVNYARVMLRYITGQCFIVPDSYPFY